MFTLDYLAGYFDADGSIGITRQKNKNGHMIHQIKATITSICPEIPTAFHSRYGGACLVSDWGHKRNKNVRVRMDWSITSKKCKLFLVEILPHLFFRKEQANVALELQASLDEYPGGIKSDDPEYQAVMNYRFSLYQKISEMKKVHYLEHYWDGGEFGENPNVRKRRGRPRAKQAYRSLSDSHVEEIVALRGVMKQEEVANIYGISQTHVSRIQKAGRV